MEYKLPFDATVTFRGGEYTVSIFPNWDDDKHESYYHVGLDGEDLGELRLNEDHNWHWVEGTSSLDEDAALAIGYKIESQFL